MTMGTDPDEVLSQEERADQKLDLEKRALRGTYYIAITYALAQGVRMLSSIVLSRMFTPVYFGVMALLTTVLVGLTLVSHIGVQDSVIQNPRGDEPAFLNTAWTLQVLRGFVIWLGTIALAWPVSIFYKEPKMIWLLPALGFGCVLSAVSSPSLLTLSRHMGVGKISSLELLSQIVQFVVTIIWARFDPSLWALVAGRIFSEITRTAISYRIMPELRPRIAWDKESVHTILHFGKWILVGTGLTFLATQSDRLILGKLISFFMLGVYGIAFSLSDLPRQIILQFCTRIGFPFIARFAENPRHEYRAILLKYRMPVLAIGGLLLIIVICTGDQFILHVYDKRYHAAAWMIGILALGLWHTLLYATISPAILSLSKTHYNALAYLVYCITLFAFVPAGFHFFGLVGAVTAVAVSDLPVYFVVLYSAYCEKVGTFTQDVIMTCAFAVGLALALGLRMALGFGLPLQGIHN